MRVAWVVLALFMALAACGQKGPLYLPGDPHSGQRQGPAPSGTPRAGAG
jgi:predicted small lipoprotein YifL